MYDCHDDLIAYHNERVTLLKPEQDEMRDRRNTNRRRLKDGLESDDEPTPTTNQSQGSYSMQTMTQHPEKDYDIDDGVYFSKDDLVGPKGGDRSPREVKEMVCKALRDKRFKKAPEVRANCVRVYYDAGYHVDVPVYRVVTKEDAFGTEQIFNEIAGSEWKRSEPVEVTRWFKNENEEQSPDKTNGRQLRRSVRFLKAFSKSRKTWPSRIANGFMITKLVVEHYQPNLEREDRALYDTIVEVYGHLEWNLEIDHPTIEGEKLTRDADDSRTKFLKKKLENAIDYLAVLFELDCTREKASKAWDDVFDTDFFVSRLEKEEAKEGSKNAESELIEPDGAVEKRGGGRYA